MSEQFGSIVPFAEPAWYGPLGHNSPYYKDSHRRLRAYCREYVETFIEKAGSWEEAGSVPKEQFLEHARRGFVAASIKPIRPELLKLAGVQLPANIDPKEWDTFHDIVLIDEMMRTGYLGVNWGIGGGNGIGGPPVVNFASQELREEILPAILRGEKRICLGVTEPTTGSDVASVSTTAVRQQDGSYVVNGMKKWITNGVFADYVTAVVRTGEPGSGAGGISVLVVPLHLDGVETRLLKNSGVNASGSTLITFDNVRVPGKYLLGKENEGFRIVMSNFNGERLALVISALRMSRTCLEDAYLYAQKRKTFGKPLFSNQVIRAKLSDMARNIERLHAWMESLAHQLNTTDKRVADMELGGQIALMKVDSGRCLEFCCREAQQILGGLGYQKGGNHAGSRIEQISRDLRVMVVGGGSDEILTDLGARMEHMKYNSKL